MQEIEFVTLDLSHTDILNKMYSSIEITEDNYLEKMSENDKSFKNSGGMFLINDDKKNREILASENDVVIGAKVDTEFCGMIWYNFSRCDYKLENINFSEDKKYYREILLEAKKNDEIFEGREIIVRPSKIKGLSYYLFKRLLEDALKFDKKYKTGEVYRVDGYEDENGYHACSLLNIPSFNILQKSGGEYVGTAPQKQIKKGNVTFYITPLVFIWNIEKAIKIVSKKIIEKGGKL